VQQRVLDTPRGNSVSRDRSRPHFLLREGTDQRYGARHLKRAIERTSSIRWRICWRTDQVNLGDLVRIDWNESHDGLSLCREGEVRSTAPSQRAAGAAAAEAMDGEVRRYGTEAAVEDRSPRRAALAGTKAASPQDARSRTGQILKRT